MKPFLDQDRRLYTCDEKSCQDCDVRDSVNCHFHLGQLLKFLAFNFPILIIGGIGAFRFSPWGLLAWAAFVLSYFGFIEIRVMCSHCPHYAEPGLKSLKCWANYGSPKLWKYRPGPMSLLEKTVFIAGLLIIGLLPIPLMVWTGDLVVLLLYLAAAVIGAYGVRHFFCAKCMNFACPLNTVGPEVRERFFSRNSVVRDAWKGHGG